MLYHSRALHNMTWYTTTITLHYKTLPDNSNVIYYSLPVQKSVRNICYDVVE